MKITVAKFEDRDIGVDETESEQTAAREVRERGTFEFAREAVPFAEINAMFRVSAR